MTYQEWAKQYFDTAERLHQKIKILKNKVKNALPGEKEKIKKELASLYYMYLDCIHTGNLLNSRTGNFE